jgi:hypothetical protein
VCPKKLKYKTLKVVLVKKMSTSQPKARFYTRINEQDYLGVTVWPGKTDPSAEVVTVQLRRNDGEKWETIARLAVYRSPDGNYTKLPERRE